MSLIPLAAPLIRLAATEDGHAQKLFDRVKRNEAAFAGLVVNPEVEPSELAELTSAEWQWYASWRQALGVELDPVVLDHLTDSASTRFARFEVRALVLRDPSTIAAQYDPSRQNAIGMKWLRAQARGARVERVLEAQLARIEEAYAAAAPAQEQYPDEAWTARVEEPLARWPALLEEALELMRDALQCATDASWFLLRELTSINEDRRGYHVSKWLERFAREREIDEEIWALWGLHEAP